MTDRPVSNVVTDDHEDLSSSSTNIDGIVINEVQLLLAEKRTSLATMRTGIAVFTLPLSVLSILIATSRYYDISQVMPLLLPLLVISTALVFLGGYLVGRATCAHPSSRASYLGDQTQERLDCGVSVKRIGKRDAELQHKRVVRQHGPVSLPRVEDSAVERLLDGHGDREAPPTGFWDAFGE